MIAKNDFDMCEFFRAIKNEFDNAVRQCQSATDEYSVYAGINIASVITDDLFAARMGKLVNDWYDEHEEAYQYASGTVFEDLPVLLAQYVIQNVLLEPETFFAIKNERGEPLMVESMRGRFVLTTMTHELARNLGYVYCCEINEVKDSVMIVGNGYRGFAIYRNSLNLVENSHFG